MEDHRPDEESRGFAQLGAPRPVPMETFEPDLAPAWAHNTNVTVLADQEMPPIFLMRQEGATEAYARADNWRRIQIDHRGPEWGDVLQAVVFPAVAHHTFAPPATEPQYVAIKRLNKHRVGEYLARGGEENPYKEICRMRELGDNQHVLQCRDALEDDTYLYIVTNWGSGTLVDVIHWGSTEPMDRERARQIFVQILQILSYLLKHRMAHRDLSPDNFLFLTDDNLVVFDLALSHRLPVDQDHQRTLAHPIGNFGTHAYMAPEMYMNRIFDGAHGDLWSASVILYNLLTNQPLYRRPRPDDLFFRYNIMARALARQPVNERTVEVLQGLQQLPNGHAMLQELMHRAMVHLGLPWEATELLEHLLQPAPQHRWSLAQARNSAFVRGVP